MSRNNLDIRAAVSNAGVYLYEVAEKLDIHDSALSRLMRKELPAEKKQLVFEAIAEIVAEREAGAAHAE